MYVHKQIFSSSLMQFKKGVPFYIKAYLNNSEEHQACLIEEYYNINQLR